LQEYRTPGRKAAKPTGFMALSAWYRRMPNIAVQPSSIPIQARKEAS